MFSTLGLVAGGILLAAGAGVGAVVLVTSGPLAQTDESADQTRTPVASATVASSASATMSATATATGVATTAPTATISPIAGEPPALACANGFTEYRLALRPWAACAPGNWTVTEDVWDGTGGRPPGYFAFTVYWRDPVTVQRVVQISAISKESDGTRETVVPLCAEWTASAPLLGEPASECLITHSDPNGGLITPSEGWILYRFAEVDSHWLLAEAAGPEVTADDIAIARGRAIGVFDSASATSLEERR